MLQEDRNRVLRDLLKERETAYIRKYCPVFEPEYGKYVVKTSAPYYTMNWKLNFLRRHREQELKDEAMKAARMKCHASANATQKCTVEYPHQEATYCKDLYHEMKSCFAQETDIEQDKRRRDMERNKEWWWQNIYDEDGPVGTQAQPPPDTYIEKTITFCYIALDKLDGWLFRHDK